MTDPSDKKPTMQHLYEKELAEELADPCGDGQFIPPKVLQDHERIIATEDLKRVRADPQRCLDMIGTKEFMAKYPDLADQVRFVGQGELTHLVDFKGNEFSLRKIPNELTDDRMIGQLDPTTGKAVIEPASGLVQGPFETAQALVDVETQAQTAFAQSEQLVEDTEEALADAEEKDERILALDKLIRDKMGEERGQIVAIIMAYAEDCEDRAEQLELSGARERKRLRKTGHVTEAEDVKKMQQARSAAFKVRAAISADIAHKIETGWGRNPDGTVQEKPNADDSDVLKEASRLNREAAHLKTV